MSLLDDNQKKQLQEISKTLRQAREEKSLRLEEVAIKTNIRLACLKALDANKFDELPEPVYIQGFIRRYADVIGLDGAAVAKTFSIAATTPEVDSQHSQSFNNKLKISVPLFIPYTVLLLASAIGLFYLINPKLSAESLKKFNLGNSKKQTTTALSTPSLSPVESSLSSEQKSTSSPTPIPTTSPVVSSPNIASQTVAVSLELQDKSWLQVKVDGKTEFTGYLTKGDRRTWTAKKQLTIRSGNAGAVLISVNNQPAKPLGNRGDVQESTFTPEVSQ